MRQSRLRLRLTRPSTENLTRIFKSIVSISRQLEIPNDVFVSAYWKFQTPSLTGPSKDAWPAIVSSDFSSDAFPEMIVKSEHEGSLDQLVSLSSDIQHHFPAQ